MAPQKVVGDVERFARGIHATVGEKQVHYVLPNVQLTGRA
jgi:hypothetical protein